LRYLIIYIFVPLINGYIVWNSDADLPLAVSNATAGQLILSTPEIVYPLENSTVCFGENIKVEKQTALNRSILYMIYN
jgi:hypothetical protein